MILAIDWNRQLTQGEAIVGVIFIVAYLVFVIVEHFVLNKDKKNV